MPSGPFSSEKLTRDPGLNGLQIDRGRDREFHASLPASRWMGSARAQADLVLGGIDSRDGAGAMRIGMTFMHHLNFTAARVVAGMVHSRHRGGQC